MNHASDIISDLQSKWDTLGDLDRARAVRAIYKNGTSLRELAKALKRSPSLLRHLLEALGAPPEDQLLARQGELTTNELVRRSKAAGIARATRQREALELERTQASLKGCKAIWDWLRGEGFSGPLGAQIVGEARQTLAVNEENKTLSRDAAPPGTPVSEIIRRCRPAELKTDATSNVTWFGRWLSLWAAYSMTDSWVRYKAIELALEIQPRR
jgi:lambda repressor-like predicted transcriptional regulator